MTRVAFLDRIDWDYRSDTPLTRPLGGSQSALCYLASALADAGHEVRMVTMTRSPGRVGNVDCLAAGQGGYTLFDGAEVVIVLNDPGPDAAQALRQRIGPEGLLVLWTQHDVDQPAMAPFADREVRRLWDRVVFVSDWQRQAYRRVFGPEPRDTVLGNAMAPAFERLFAEGESIEDAKPGLRSGPPVLVYTSTPFRGLTVLLDAFPLIQARVPDVRLRIHSSLGVYQVAEAQDAFGDLYRRCRAMPGVDYLGAVPQPALAGSLKSALCLAYPSTFPETFCTAALEAMAAGCLAVLGDLGALAETTQGLAELVPLSSPSADHDPGDYAHRFAGRVVDAIGGDRRALAQRLESQRRHLLATSTWGRRAEAWSRWLETALAEHRLGTKERNHA
jgi:glycosyltransferase involved in cell wall biosynthesis